ncbi:ferrous iron transport protein B [Clostridium homopropionicum DSM 5847]|uniref:Ferrous iron transport protein B n=1 Tax=Clostridium homopropionicum DSM 5847 TaxID=1121318 RepID=A0A0L6ZAE5_9CLOT|nr:ferrous iron transport protein B [Clostridium homopropionicum]KOA19743.1 ferrous iron transport protein B [Clostridium homopropionicum DSM 5847]SFF78503.1 ferrous iron transport protein B [Clostridium homopropionicum]
MGLTYKTSQKSSLKDMFNIDKNEKEHVITLAGNPNTGKSTVFNSLTGLRQHTGNWPGKTVVNAMGNFNYKNDNYILVDLPGTYSIFASSVEEVVARDFICFGNPEAVIVVADATCLERNLNLLFQIMELTRNVILCINLIDEAKKKNITVDGRGIEKELGIPVILTAARSGFGINELLECIKTATKKEYSFSNLRITYSDEIETLVRQLEPLVTEIIPSINSRWLSLRLIDGDKGILNSMEQYLSDEEILNLKAISENLKLQSSREKIREYINEENYKTAKLIKDRYVKEDAERFKRDEKIDNIITSKRFGIPLMLLLLGAIFWITIKGANLPSQVLSDILFSFEKKLTAWFTYLNAPTWLHGVLVLGLYRTLAWVVSVMLPPMAIFFPIFTLLEDLGYLPRIAFNMDHLFKRACAHGKQCLTMCMGFGCNAAGVIGCRIIESPRERIIAILTNNFVPCNGRFPTLIAISTIFFTMSSDKKVSSLIPAFSVTLLVIIGIAVTLFVSYLLSKTVLKGVPSSFTLELPPYRRPQLLRLIYTSVIDRTIFVLLRAVLIAAPAGAIIWVLGNAFIGNMNILDHIASFLDPIGKFIGLDGFILMAFILGLPANEIVLPILLMAYLSTGSIIEFDSIEALNNILQSHGWTPLTALNTMLFSLLHWPCSTTIWTIKKETQSIKWTVFSIVIPTLIAFLVCFITTCIYRFIT